MILKKLALVAVVGLCPLVAVSAEPWREVTMPTVGEAAKSFANPPREFGAIHWAIWGGQQTKERILADIEHVNASGAGVFMINNSRGLRPAYFTPEYLELVKFAVEECKKRGMKVWIEGDAGYPDGFAGGMISKQYPELAMQGIVADARYTVVGGATLSIPLPTDTLGIFATQRSDAATAAGATASAPARNELPVPKDGKLKWTGPSWVGQSGGSWEVTLRGPSGEGRYSLVAGQTLSITIPPDTESIEEGPRSGRGGRGGSSGQVLPMPADGQFKWTAPETGTWEVTFARHVYRSSPTRFVDRDDGTNDKDSLYSLIDYLDPKATAAYLKLVHERYEKLLGEEFGKTVLGFRADETDYTGIMPWTPKLLETFRAQKGYDLAPFIPMFFMNPLTPDAQRAKADYWDVWSGMFRDNFYKPLEEWCEARNMKYMAHLNHEETMLNRNGGEGMITNEGSFFRDMRYMGVPGVDNLNQIGPGIVADFPKLAASAAHVFGRPLVWDEEGGATGQTGKFIIDYQLVRGINYMNIRGINSAPTTGDATILQDPAAATGWYVTRSQHLLAMGRPAAQVALFHPTDSYWMGDQEADAVTVRLTTELLEHQIDFDHIDADSLGDLCTLAGDGLKNLSGQVYRAVIVPTSTVIEKKVLERLREFAGGGGKVIFVGRTPTMVVDRSFLHAEEGAPDLSFAMLEATADITDRVVAALPAPDVKLDAACPALKYIHRSLKDGEVYFFFNESAESQSRAATLAGSGEAQVWDATSGTIHPLAGVRKEKASVAVPLSLAAHEARFIVIGALPADMGDTFARGEKLVGAIDGDWSVTLNDKELTTSLKSWQELGVSSFNGIAEYRKSFDYKTGDGIADFMPASVQSGRRVYLDLGNVREVAAIRVNGKDFAARSWSPFVWDVTDALKAGENTLVVRVQVPPGGGRGFGSGGAIAGATAGGGRAAGRGRGPGVGSATAVPATPSASGLLGPVRLMTQ